MMDSNGARDDSQEKDAAWSFETSSRRLSVENAQDEESVLHTGQDEILRLGGMAAEVRDQDQLERDIGHQADQLLTEKANERDQKRLDKARSDKVKLEAQIIKLRSHLNGSQALGSVTSVRLQAEVSNCDAQIESLETDISQILERIEERQRELLERPDILEGGSRRLATETQREFLIRTGKITPFARVSGERPARTEVNLRDALYNVEAAPEQSSEEESHDFGPSREAARSHRVLLRPGFVDDEASYTSSDHTETVSRPTKRRRLENSLSSNDGESANRKPSIAQESSFDYSAYDPQNDEINPTHESDSIVSEETDDYLRSTPTPKRKRRPLKQEIAERGDLESFAGIDDGNEDVYQSRLRNWIKRRKTARQKAQAKLFAETSHEVSVDEIEEEWYMSHPTIVDTRISEGFQMPGDIFPSLFDYQKTGVQWLWELYSQRVGGIVGDEMGLGKTIQVISFLAGLHHSKMIIPGKPIIVVAPATVMKQWVNEFHTWWPPFRVSILHSSGSGMLDTGRESRMEEGLLLQRPSRNHTGSSKAQKAAQKIVDRVVAEGHVLVTTYTGLLTYANLLIPVLWEYAVLDEGHKIRNPNAGITIAAKELRTPNRIILSGTPMQNNLIELWSLFDFIFPMRLATLVDFKNQFEIPIRIGGYANASNLQVQTATKCAEALKEAISPYLLQRMKSDVAADLPKKTERVLFCKLTKIQRDAYEAFLNGDDMKSILSGRRQALYGIDILRKICNHPDLQDHKTLSTKVGYTYGSGNKSGKMVVVRELLDIWRRTGHKTLLFAQHRIMLDILESYIKGMDGINYRRMDGTTPIATRQGLVDEFNSDTNAHVFLLTTKVGGLGINLTGADRVIIYDPDWNPSTDVQARERAWRLGQKREVEIYRLMSAGTIEEKIFHRQIFKQFLTNKILKDPKQRQTFQISDLHDLFTLGDATEGATETGRLFKDAEVSFQAQTKAQDTRDRHDNSNVDMTPKQILKSPMSNDQALDELSGVSSVQPYAAGEESEHMKDHGQNSSDQRIMQGIFARSGVHSALEHDQIVNGRRVITADPRIIEREAKRIAAEAAGELKKAEEVARTIPAGVPTWTGQFGSGGLPDAQRAPVRGAASSGILSGLQNRSIGIGGSDSSRSSTPIGVGPSGRKKGLGTDFLTKIRNFLLAHGGRVYTQNLIDQFNRYCTTPERTAEFKAMIREIAVLEKGSRGRGAWVLKDEYGSGR